MDFEGDFRRDVIRYLSNGNVFGIGWSFVVECFWSFSLFVEKI